MHPFELNEDNFIIYAIKHYDNPGCLGLVEFHDDLRRFKYLKILFKKYIETGDLRERLIINHLVVLNNLFGVEASSKMLVFKIKEEHWSQLKTFLLYLNMDIHQLEDVPFDNRIVEILRKI